MEIPVNHIDIVNGKAVLRGRNIKVKMIAGAYIKAAMSIEAIMEQYDLTPAEVHAALAYYYDNREAFEREEAELRPLHEAAKRESDARLAKMKTRLKQE